MTHRGARPRRRLAAVLALGLTAGLAPPTAQAEASPAKPDGAVRVAQFNLHLSRGGPGVLLAQLTDPAAHPETRDQVDALAEILQRVRPDVLLVQELDFDERQAALGRFADTLLRPRDGGLVGLDLPHRFAAPVNAGALSGLDLDGDGKASGPGDAFGWGVFPGQFGMGVLSRFPLDRDTVRRFRFVRWAAAPFAQSLHAQPRQADGAPFYPPGIWERLRLSSKSHWDIAVVLPGGTRLRLLASHPTPPVFDGPEDRNGLRNAAEILFWRDYVAGDGWMSDDRGAPGALPPETSFVILGDLNADPLDGDGRRHGINGLLNADRVADPRPSSPGGAFAAMAQGGANADQRGDPGLDTADFGDEPGRGPGNLRVDYVLPSSDLTVLGAGVFWPRPEDPLYRLVGDGSRIISSDHRLVWVDIALSK